MSKNGVLVVTGGSRGIGAAVSLLAAEAVVSAIHKSGAEAIAVRGDVSLTEDVEHIFAAADRMGRLAGLVNNAGIVGPTTRVEDMTAERINHILAVNVTGSFLCAIAAIKRMSTKHGGQGGGIVNIGSAASKLGGVNSYVDYAAAKGAIDTFTVGLALEVAGEGIRVNSVRPGVIDTDIHASGGDPGRAARMAPSFPIPRPGTAREVANAVMWLLSDEASYSTGTTLTVSGGRAILP